MASTMSTSCAPLKQIEHLFWPPKHLLPPNAKESDRIDLLTYLDAEVYNTRGSYPLKLPYGVTVLRDRVVLEMERFSSPSRDHQTALATQFQASFAEQGFAVVVKEWANPTQKRSILRVRLKCRFAGCKFHFQINWDQNMGYWFISRRRCGIFQHSCRTQDGPAPVSLLSKRAPVADSPQPNYASAAKRSRIEHHHPPHSHHMHAAGKPGPDQSFLITPDITAATTIRTVSADSASGETTPATKESKPTSGKGSENAMDFAESLLELSKGKQDKDSPDSQEREPHDPHKPEDNKREPHGSKPSHPPSMGHSNIRTRSIILGEIPHGTQAFVQMAQTMGPNMFTHLVHGRGECQLTMSFDGEGFVLRTNLPSAPPPLPPPPPRAQQSHRPPLDAKTAHAMGGAGGPLNYPYLPPRRYPPGHPRNDPNVVML